MRAHHFSPLLACRIPLTGYGGAEELRAGGSPSPVAVNAVVAVTVHTEFGSPRADESRPWNEAARAAACGPPVPPVPAVPAAAPGPDPVRG
ncbi:hypothetical protein ACIQF5_23775 [Streptomyces goshikiensis]|uniref:hypothetical protein n=1 Tax=Streptomyces goshikiensis TaxID=1942 RepID=UPI0037FEA90E